VHDIARINTLGIVIRRPKRPRYKPASPVRAQAGDLEEVVAFLRQHGRRRQYYPAYRVTDFGEGGILPGLEPHDVILAKRGDAIIGTIAVWDQSAYKQTMVHSYGGRLERLRVWFDRIAPLSGAAPLPAPGEEIRSAYAALVCVADDDPGVMRTLLREAYNDACRRGFAYLMIGLTDEDPLLRVARRYLHIPYRAWLQASAWRPGEVGCDLYPTLDDRPAYVEIAAL
jgi:hypothetical protein